MNISGSLIDKLRSAFSGEERVGSSIQLTIDAELTAYISSIFPEGKDGAVCVINYKTGEVLSWVSKPDYDPSDLLDGSTEGDNIADTAFLNRCLQGLYMPCLLYTSPPETGGIRAACRRPRWTKPRASARLPQR